MARADDYLDDLVSNLNSKFGLSEHIYIARRSPASPYQPEIPQQLIITAYANPMSVQFIDSVVPFTTWQAVISILFKPSLDSVNNINLFMSVIETIAGYVSRDYIYETEDDHERTTETKQVEIAVETGRDNTISGVLTWAVDLETDTGLDFGGLFIGDPPPPSPYTITSTELETVIG